jgi:hypothetical protein
MTTKLHHCYAHTNGIRMHYVEQGAGPLEYDAMETNCTRLVGKHLIPGAGHWIQQERPTEVNDPLTRFLTEQVAAGAMA